MSQPSIDEAPLPPDAARVTETLARIRAGVRQRHARLAIAADEAKQLPAAFVHLQAMHRLDPPMPVSHRPLVGPVLVFAKTVFYQVFLKWWVRSLFEQQNAFNRAVVLAFQDVFERQQLVLEALTAATGTSEPAAQSPAAPTVGTSESRGA